MRILDILHNLIRPLKYEEITPTFLTKASYARYLLIGVYVLLGAGCHEKKQPPPTPSFPVQVAQAVQKEIPLFIEALGHVESMTSIDIRSRIEGELTGVYFKQGQEVKQGDLLFTIDPKPYEADLKTAQGALEQALANLSLAEEKVKRYRMLVKDEYYSQIDYETLQADMAANTALVEENQGRVDAAKINLDYCWIYAPINGMTGILQVDFGNLIGNDQSTPLITLKQMSPIFVTFSVPEFQLPKIQKADRNKTLKVIAAYENFTSDSIFQGSLYMIDNSVDDQTGMIKLRAIFDNQDRALWPGQFIRNRLILDTISHAVMVPYTAIQMTQSGPVIFVVKDNMTVDQRSVKLGQRMDDQIAILQGIQAGETIVIEGQINLFQQAKVFISGKKR